MLKVIELFGGIGACTESLKNIGIPFQVVDYVEIDKYAVASYNAINGTDFKPKDIRNYSDTVEADLIAHGSPCQDFSLGGKGAGGDEGSGTRSSLMYETLKVVERVKPKYVLWENVKNILSKKHRHNFDNYLNKMEELGYNNYYQILNAKDYGIPQNRERVFTISIRKDLDNGSFKFPEKEELKLRLKDMLEAKVDDKFYLDEQGLKNYLREWGCKGKELNEEGNAPTLTAGMGEGGGNIPILKVKNNTKQGYLEAQEWDGVDTSGRMQYHRGNVQKQMAQTLTTEGQDRGVVIPQVVGGIGEKNSNNGRQWYLQNRVYADNIATSVTTAFQPYYENNLSIRKLSPRECWRLMRFKDETFDKVKDINSNTQLYKQAGNSIVVNVLEKILKNLFKE